VCVRKGPTLKVIR